MVAYSFQKRFVPSILDGSKGQTIRGRRKRQTRPGEDLQLYTAMRTKYCSLVARVTCREVVPVKLLFSATGEAVSFTVDGIILTPAAMDRFAVADGFSDVDDMAAFWSENHPKVDRFDGDLIRWWAIGLKLLSEVGA